MTVRKGLRLRQTVEIDGCDVVSSGGLVVGHEAKTSWAGWAGMA